MRKKEMKGMGKKYKRALQSIPTTFHKVIVEIVVSLREWAQTYIVRPTTNIFNVCLLGRKNRTSKKKEIGE